MSLAHTQALDSPETNAAECSRLLRDYNALITCPLCRGYLIEATTVTECLHAFCRSCILQYVEHNAACPVCQVPLQSARPHTQLRRDHTLQTIVYKLVPDLSKKELQRRLDFYAKQGNCVGVAQAAKELHLEGFFSPTDSISFSMEFVPFPFEKEPWKPGVVTQETNEFHHGIRYFKCPAAVTIRLLEKLLRRKYQVGDNYNVDFFYGRAKLCPEYRLSDVAYIFAWKQMEPLRLRYHFSPVSTELTNALPPVPPPNLPVLPATVSLPPVKVETSESSKPFVQKRKVSACSVSDFPVPEVKKELPPAKLAGDSTSHQCGKHSPVASQEISGGNKRKRRKKSRKKQIGVRRKSHGKHIIEAQARSRVVPDVHLKDEPNFNASPAREGATSSVTPVTQPPCPENLPKPSVEAMETTSSPEKGSNPKPKSSRPVPGLISLNQEPLTFNFELNDSPPNAKRRKTTPQQTTGSQSSAKSSRASGPCTGLQPDKASGAKKPKISPSHRKPSKRVLKNGTRDDSVVVRKKKENENTPKKTSTDDRSLSYLSLSPNDTVTKEDFTKLLDLKPVQRPPLLSPTTDAPVPSAPSSSATLVTTSLNAQNFSVCPVMSSVSLDRMNKSFVIQNSPVECPTSASFPASVTHPAHFLNNQVTITAVPKKLPPKPLRTAPSKNTGSRRSNPASYTRPPLPKPTASPATTSGRSNPFNFIKLSDYSRAAALFVSSVGNKNASTVLAGTDGVGVRFPHRGEPSATRSGICPKTLIDAALGLSQIHVNLRPPPGPLPALKPLTRYLPTPDPNALARPPPAAHPVATATKTRSTGDQEGSDVDLLIIDESSSTVSSETGALDLSHPRSPPSTVAAPSLARELVCSAKSTASPVPGSKAPSPMKAPPSHNTTKPVLPSTTATKDAPKTVASAWAATAAQYGNLDLLQNWFSRFGLPVSAGGLKSLPLRPNTSKQDEQGTTESSSNAAGLSKKFVPCLATKMDPKKNAVIKIPTAPNRTKVAGTPETS